MHISISVYLSTDSDEWELENWWLWWKWSQSFWKSEGKFFFDFMQSGDYEQNMTDSCFIHLQSTCNLLMYFFPICGKEGWEHHRPKFFSKVNEYVLLKCKGYISVENGVKSGWKKLSKNISNYFMKTQRITQCIQ